MLGSFIRLAVFSCMLAVCVCRLTTINTANQFDTATGVDRCMLMLDNQNAIESRGLRRRFDIASNNPRFTRTPFLYANCNSQNIRSKCLEIVNDIETDLPAFFPCLTGGLSQEEYVFSITPERIQQFFNEN